MTDSLARSPDSARGPPAWEAGPVATLPPGFDHPHSSEEARRIAERGMILPAQPDRRWVDEWLHRTHLAYWREL